MIKSVRLAKWWMTRWESTPSEDDLRLNETFRHPSFTQSDPETQQRIMRASSELPYHHDQRHPSLERHFSIDLRPLLAGKRVLDIGCYTGGRSVALAQYYGFAELSGIDIAPIYIKAARSFADSHGIAAEFRLARGEELPYPHEFFDTVISFDVFEHVADLRKTMAEAWRVLKPEGHLIIVFPQYLHPFEHHCGLVTKMPAIQWIFDPKTINAAYSQILTERGSDADWYKNKFSPWEKLYSINGTSIREFERIIEERGWTKLHTEFSVCLSNTRRARSSRFLRMVFTAVKPLLYFRALHEYLLGRIAVVLQKSR
jgi:2-polyprenyl-3-methyl-5-hydroxy-6-metoxy-1,4-benzoquinol methylase